MGKNQKRKKASFHPLQQNNNPYIWKINKEKLNNLLELISNTKVIYDAILAQDIEALKKFVAFKFSIPESEIILYENILEKDNLALLTYLTEELKFTFKELKKVSGHTLLTIAICKGAAKCVQFFLQQGFDPNKQTYPKFSPLKLALIYDKPKIAQELLNYNAVFDYSTLEILAQSPIPHKEAYTILNNVKNLSNLRRIDLVKKYKILKQGQKPIAPGTWEKNIILTEITQCASFTNNCNKLIFLEEHNLLSKLIKSGRKLVEENFLKLETLSNVSEQYKKKITENTSVLLKYLTNIYGILIIELPYNEEFEGFLIKSLDMHNNLSFSLEFNRYLLSIYFNATNPYKFVNYGEKVYGLLEKSLEFEDIKLKHGILRNLVPACKLIKLDNKARLYKQEETQLIHEYPSLIENDSLACPNIQDTQKQMIEKFESLGINTQICKEWNEQDNYELFWNHHNFIRNTVVGLLARYQQLNKWQDGLELLELCYISTYFRLHNHLDLQYYEFVFHYHIDKNSYKVREIFSNFYSQALKNVLWLEKIDKIYGIAIFQELVDGNIKKLQCYLEELKILENCSIAKNNGTNIKGLRQELGYLLKNLKTQTLNATPQETTDSIKTIESKEQVEDKKIGDIQEEVILRLPKDRKTFSEIEILLASEDYEEINKINSETLRKYYIYKRSELEKQKFIEEHNLKVSWYIKGKVYKANTDTITQIDKYGKYFGTIKEKLKENLDIATLKQYNTALQKGIIHRKQGISGIKQLENGVLELKIDAEHRLVSQNPYKNLQGKYLIIFNYEKKHSEISKNISEFCLNPIDVPDQPNLPLTGEGVDFNL